MMAPPKYPDPDEPARVEDLRRKAQNAKWTDDYLDLAMRAAQETQGRVNGSSGDWAYIFGKKCFLGDMRGDPADKTIGGACNVQVPVLILQGKEMDDPMADGAADIDRIIADAGNAAHTLTYYAYLGQFFGQRVCDGLHRCFYETDAEVLENIRKWIIGIL